MPKSNRAGWVIQDKSFLNLNESLGVTVRKTYTDIGPADYKLFIDDKACGVIEAKREGADLGYVSKQSARFATMNELNKLEYVFKLRDQLVKESSSFSRSFFGRTAFDIN